MTPKQFDSYWTTTYPKTIPIPHFLKWDYPERWFRIHSLPESKRYAENDVEWEILLDRQNAIINDLIGDTEFFMITGDYNTNRTNSIRTFIKGSKFFRKMIFHQLPRINLKAKDPAEYDERSYTPVISKQNWKPNKFNAILKGIANDEIRAFFMSTHRTCLIAPYDGGVDIIMESEELRDTYKAKYKNWLSYTDDGY